jgi:Raf kinase inhibitor-like YbhB/YbcL family protein
MMKTFAKVGGAVAIVFLILYLVTSATGVRAEGGNEAMEIKSGAFQEGGTIPQKYTCMGEDVSPALSWTDPPKGTKSLALIVDDPDSPMGTWVHWVLFDLSPDVKKLDEGVPPDGEVLKGAKQGRNDFGNLGYGGPCPPPGPPHRYNFKLYALDIKPTLSVGATKAELLMAMEGHILGEAKLMGRFGRS